MPKISVIIPVYNVEKYLGWCLDSVIHQTLQDIEIICVNDGSTDNSLKILEDYAKRDNRIKIINKSNEGLGAARNSGIRISNGDYLYYLDSDDWISLDCLEKLYNQITEDKADVCIMGAKLYDDVNHCYLPRNNFYNLSMYKNRLNRVCNYKEIKNTVFRRFEAMFKLQNRDFVINNNLYFPQGCYFEDVVPHIKTMVLANRITFLNENLYYFRQNRAGSLMDLAKKEKRVFDVFKFFEVAYDFIDSNDLWKELDYYFCEFIINECLYHYNRICSNSLKSEFLNLYKNFIKQYNIEQRLEEYPNLKSKYINNFVKPFKLSKKIFSVSNDGIYKKFVIFGMCFKFKSRRLAQREEYRHICSKLDEINNMLEDICSNNGVA